MARGLISGTTLGFYRPWEQAGKAGAPELISSIAAGAIPYTGLARGVGLGVAGLGRFAPKLLAAGVPARQAAQNIATLKPWHAALSSRGRILTTGGAMAGMSGLPELWSDQPKTTTERLTGAALSAGLGMATEGALQRLFRVPGAARAATAGLGAHPTVTQQPLEWLERPLREEYAAVIGRLQARRVDVQQAAAQATEGILDKKSFKVIQKGFRKQIKDIDDRIEELTKRAADQGGISLGSQVEEMGLPLGQDVIEGVTRPAWSVTPPVAARAAEAQVWAGLSNRDLKAFLKDRGTTVSENTPRERMVQLLTQKALPPLTGGMPTRRSILPGVNVSVPTIAEGTKKLIPGLAPTLGGGVLPYTRISPPPELAKKFGLGIGVTEVDPITKMIVNPDSWVRKAKNILKSDPTGIDPELLGPGIYMVRNAKGKLLPRDIRLASDIANDSMFPSLADIICR